MGTNQNGKRFYQVKIKGLDVTSLKELGWLMGPLQRQAFRKVYGKILDLTTAEVFTEAVVCLAQYYDQPLRCFTFGDFQIVPTVEEFEEYQDIFEWSYQDMPGLDLNIVLHKLPLNPGSSPVKQKLRRMRPEMSLKIKEVRK